MADWANVDALLKAYRSDLTSKATNLQNFYSQISSTPSASTPPVANGIGTPINWSDIAQQSPGVANRGGPSVISRVFDVLSRPGYAVSEAARQLAVDDPSDTNRADNAVKGLWEGISGHRKTRMENVLNELEFNAAKKKPEDIPQDVWDKMSNEDKFGIPGNRFTENIGTPNLNPEDYKSVDKGEGSISDAILGLTLDVSTDPLNVIGGPIFKGISKGGGAIARTVTGAEDLNKIQLPAQAAYYAPTSRIFNQAKAGKAVPSSLLVSESTNPIIKAFSTRAYNKILRPDVMSTVQAAKARAITRSAVLNKIARNYTPDQQKEAFQIAQGQLPATGAANIDKLGDEFFNSVNDLVNHSDMREYAILANNGIRDTTDNLIKQVNEQLRMHGEKFQFSKKMKDPNTGKDVDLSRKTDWLQSWRFHKFEDPLTFTSKLGHAIENVTAKNQFLDDFAYRFGSKTLKTDRSLLSNGKQALAHNAGIRNSRLKDLYFDKSIAKEMNHVLKNWDQISNPRSPFIKALDEVTSLWKTGVTIYAPSHHIRNLIGDTYFNWMDGVNTIRPYQIAKRTLQTQRNRYSGVANVNDLTAKSAFSNASTTAGNVALTTKGGLPFTYQQLYTAAYSKGLLQSANTIEDITDRIVDLKNLSNPVLRKIANPTGGRISEKVRAGSELREHYVKLAHFADILKKSKADNLEDAVTEAANRVRKWHPDGLDLTDVERNYARRIMPFYSWSRKAIPLIVESTVRKPGKALFYPRFMQMIQDATGTPGNNISDPFPEDQLFPDWIKEKGIGPIAYHGMGGIPDFLTGAARSGSDQEGNSAGYNIVNPSNPLIDTVAQLGGMGNPKDTIQGIMSMVNPAFRVPAEIGTGTTALGTPISYDPAGYTAQQIPFLSYLASMGNTTPFGSTARGEKEGHPNWENIINFLTALGLKGTGANTKQAEFEAKERAKQAMGG